MYMFCRSREVKFSAQKTNKKIPSHNIPFFMKKIVPELAYYILEQENYSYRMH